MRILSVSFISLLFLPPLEDFFHSNTRRWFQAKSQRERNIPVPLTPGSPAQPGPPFLWCHEHLCFSRHSIPSPAEPHSLISTRSKCISLGSGIYGMLTFGHLTEGRATPKSSFWGYLFNYLNGRDRVSIASSLPKCTQMSGLGWAKARNQKFDFLHVWQKPIP